MPAIPPLSPEATHLLLSINPVEASLVNPFAADWLFLQESENKLIAFMKEQPAPAGGEMEYGFILYLLNQQTGIVLAALKALGMPGTNIQPSDWSTWMNEIVEGPGVLADDGTLYLFTKYAQLDPGWTESLIHYFFNKNHKGTFPQPGTSSTIPNQDSLTIAIIGDWGTGNTYKDFGFLPPSVLVGNAVKALDPAPDITMHLGDVYYAGMDYEESGKLLATFPQSAMGNFTLNSNHEMYDAAKGYFGTALAADFFKEQKGASFFARRFGNFVLVGLDTAFYDTSAMYFGGALVDETQLSFIKSLNITAEEKIVLFTHHNGLLVDGTTTNEPLFTQVKNAFGGRVPDYWYYGHIHNGIVYNEESVAGRFAEGGSYPKIRCVGHAAIPFGKAPALFTNAGTIPGVSYFSQTPMPNSNPPTKLLGKRVLNGFAVITLTASTLTEQFYEVSAVDGTTKVWNG